MLKLLKTDARLVLHYHKYAAMRPQDKASVKKYVKEHDVLAVYEGSAPSFF